MSVQFADKALDEWLTQEIANAKKLVEAAGIELEVYRKSSAGLSMIAQNNFNLKSGYLYALDATQKQLHEFWGAALKSDQE